MSGNAFRRGKGESDVERFWKFIEPFRRRIPPKTFQQLVAGLAFLKESSGRLEGHAKAVRDSMEDPSSKAYIRDPKQRGEKIDSLLEDRKRVISVGLIWLPTTARWAAIRGIGNTQKLARVIDRALNAAREENPHLQGVIPPIEAWGKLEPSQLEEIVQALSGIPRDSAEARGISVLAEEYRVLLTEFVPGHAAKKKAATLQPADIFKSGAFPAPDAGGTGGGAQDDIWSLGPLYLKQPTGKPFMLVPNAQYDQWDPHVIFDGTNYLAVWREARYTNGKCLVGARITPQGKVLDKGGFLVAQYYQQYFHRMACGKNPQTGKAVSLVVWADYQVIQNWSYIRGAIIAADGKVSVVQRTKTQILSYTGTNAVQSGGMAIFPDIDGHFNPYMDYPALGNYDYPDVTFNGTDFVVVCAYEGSIIARLVDPATGNLRLEQPVTKDVIYPQGKPITIKIATAKKGAPYNPRITYAGNGECLVTWNCTASAGVGELWGVKIKFSGTNCTIGTPKIISATSEPPYGNCETDSDGAGSYGLAWHDISLAAKKKTEAWETAWPDLFKGMLGKTAGKPMDFTIKGCGALYTAATQDYYPRIAFDGIHYLITFDAITSDLIFHNPKLGCSKAIVIGAYVAPDGAFKEGFVIEPEDGNHATVGDACFGNGSEGLLVYVRRNGDPWNLTEPERMIRARFVAKSPITIYQTIPINKAVPKP